MDNEETKQKHMLSVCFGREGRCGYLGGIWEPFMLGGGAMHPPTHDDSEPCPRCGECNWDGYGIEAYNARFTGALTEPINRT